MEGGTLVGLVALLRTRSPITAGHIGVSSFALISCANWELVQYNARKSRETFERFQRAIAGRRRREAKDDDEDHARETSINRSSPTLPPRLNPALSLSIPGVRFLHTHAQPSTSASAPLFSSPSSPSASPSPSRPKSLYSQLSFACRRGDFPAALSHLSSLESQGRADIRTYTTVLQSAFRLGRSDVADAVLLRISRRGIAWDDFLFESVVRFLSLRGRWHESLSLIERAAVSGSHAVSVSAVNALLGAAPDADKDAAYASLLAAGAPIDFHSVNIVMAARVRSGDVDGAAEALASSPVAANTVNYNTLMLAHAHAGDAAALCGAYDAMRSRGLSPDHVTFNAALMGANCASGGDIRRVIDDMWRPTNGKSKISPDRHAYPLLLRLCARDGDVAAAVDAMQHYCALPPPSSSSSSASLSWFRAPPPPSESSALFAQALRVCASARDEAAAHTLLDMMVSHGVPVDAAVMRALLRVSGDYERLSAAAAGAPPLDDDSAMALVYDRVRGDTNVSREELLRLDGVRRAQGRPLSPNVARAFLRAYVRRCSGGGDMQAALAVCDELRAAGHAPSGDELIPLMEMAGRCHNAAAVLSIWRMLTQAGAGARSLAEHNSFLMALVRCGDVAAAEEAIVKMKVGGVVPTRATYALMMQAAMRAPADAVKVYRMWEEHLGGVRAEGGLGEPMGSEGMARHALDVMASSIASSKDNNLKAVSEGETNLLSTDSSSVTSSKSDSSYSPSYSATVSSPSSSWSNEETPRHPASLLVQSLVRNGQLERAVDFVQETFHGDWLAGAAPAQRAVAAYCGNTVVRALVSFDDHVDDHVDEEEASGMSRRRRLGLAVRVVRAHQQLRIPVYKASIAAMSRVTGEEAMSLPKQVGAMGGMLYRTRRDAVGEEAPVAVA